MEIRNLHFSAMISHNQCGLPKWQPARWICHVCQSSEIMKYIICNVSFEKIVASIHIPTVTYVGISAFVQQIVQDSSLPIVCSVMKKHSSINRCIHINFLESNNSILVFYNYMNSLFYCHCYANKLGQIQ